MPCETDSEDLALAHTFAALNGLEGALPIDDGAGAVPRGRAARRRAGRRASRRCGCSAAGRRSSTTAIRRRGFRADRAAVRRSGPVAARDRQDDRRAAAAQLRAERRAAAAAEMRDALDGFRAIGERWGIGFTLSALGDLAAASGDFAQAVQLAAGGARAGPRGRHPGGLPQLEVKLAHQLWLAGERDEARRMLKQARQSAEEVGAARGDGVGASTATPRVARVEGDLDEARGDGWHATPSRSTGRRSRRSSGR